MCETRRVEMAEIAPSTQGWWVQSTKEQPVCFDDTDSNNASRQICVALMSSTNSLDNFIASWVLHQKKFLTYRLLSRERSIHVDDARR